MKKILVTGKNSYIGNSVENWLLKEPKNYEIHKISLKDKSWKEKNFSEYDVIIHVAGIAHVSSDSKLEDTYYKINRDLTVDVAKKAKKDGIKQFIFMSSMIVYGNSGRIGELKNITKDTIPKPDDFYGNSKLQAEKGLEKLVDTSFKVVIIRPPMIYGKESKGNYSKLAKVAKSLPIFPNIKNQRSMLHIDNLCEFIKLMIINEEVGTYFPQNKEYVTTSKMVKEISEFYEKKIVLTSIFNKPIAMLSRRVRFLNKIFGNLTYDKELSIYHTNYQVRSFESSIKNTESRN